MKNTYSHVSNAIIKPPQKKISIYIQNQLMEETQEKKLGKVKTKEVHDEAQSRLQKIQNTTSKILSSLIDKGLTRLKHVLKI